MYIGCILGVFGVYMEYLEVFRGVLDVYTCITGVHRCKYGHTGV